MSDNSNLHKAKAEKNDEFYTKLDDIANELKHYIPHFKGKRVYCNCDGPESKFVDFFKQKFHEYGLKELVYSGYTEGAESAVLWSYDGEKVQGLKIDDYDGDFRSFESLSALKMSDIVVTNPPFSLFREFVAMMTAYQKKYLIIGPMNAMTYKEIFPLIKDNEMWLGLTHPKEFVTPGNVLQKFGNIYWYTNLDYPKRHEPFELGRRYDPATYPKYDGRDVINVNKVADIPEDYQGTMGVPMTYLEHHNPDEFEIVGEAKHGCDSDLDLFKPKIGGKEMYTRILIRRIKPLKTEKEE